MWYPPRGMSARLFGEDVLFAQRQLKSQGLYAGALDGVWGPKTDAAHTAFELQSATIAEELGKFDARSERELATLALPAQRVMRGLLTFLNRVNLGSEDVAVRIVSGTRTYAEQDALYAQGRTRNTLPVVTKAKGGQSNHNFGIAVDIGIFIAGEYLAESPMYETAGRLALDAVPGLEWGGNWNSIVDRPHYQLATGLEIAEVRRRFEAGQSYIPA